MQQLGRPARYLVAMLSALDLSIIAAYFALALFVGLWAARRSGESSKGFFLAGQDMPWWLLGVSMVATTFSTDTPNLVANIVRTDGVAGNWAWWAFLLTGMLTVFVYARLWRRTGVVTDIEFYELRYGGRAAAFLRGFRALYLGLVFNVCVMAGVSLAAIKLGAILLGWPGWVTLAVAGAVTLAYSGLGGLRAVILTDFVQFVLAMIGSVWAAIVLVNREEVGGLTKLLEHPNVSDKLAMLPSFAEPEVWVPLMLVPLAVQWWAAYYPGSEPGGGGYIAQRMLSARGEGHAVGATLLYNVAHYALRPWPWILVALASLVVFPDTASMAAAFPDVPADKVGDDLAYPAMLSLLPSGLLGLVAASLLAAFMSTMSTQLNLGASYLVNDFWGRFIKPNATDAERVRAGRIATALSLVLGSGLGLLLTDAGQAFSILLLLGAGTGGLYVLRWFWWRVSAATEIVAMVASLVVAATMTFAVPDEALAGHEKLALGAAITTAIWLGSAFVMRPEDDAVLQRFVDVVRPGGPGWSRFVPATGGEPWPVPRGLLSMALGCVAVYGALLGTGHLIYGERGPAFTLLGVAAAAGLGLAAAQRRNISALG